MHEDWFVIGNQVLTSPCYEDCLQLLGPWSPDLLSMLKAGRPEMHLEGTHRHAMSTSGL